jgi:GYF domain 2
MTAPPSQIQWYLARDGRQFGPLSEAELAKFIDLGHLQPTDLLWRDGFADWRPAMVVFPRKPVQQPAPTARASAARAPAAVAPSVAQPRAAPTRERSSAMTPMRGPEARPAPAPRRRRTALLTLICLAALAGALFYGYSHRTRLWRLIGSASSIAMTAAFQGHDSKDFDVPPLVGFTGSIESVDATLQATPLWRILKRDFPDWYGERLKEAAALAAQNKNDGAIGLQMARALVALRRQNFTYALAASFPKLKAVATTFYANLVELQKQSNDACFEFISQGEASSTVVTLLQGSPHVAHLQAQLTAVFEAIADGRTAARVYPQPRKSDYDALASDLTQRGWTQADMQLFSDERALAHAGAAKVCQMVHDWFAAQLGIKDADMQLRLLVDSLKPVVAG